ncbi:MAG: SDR family NAD(P)-dependent oxidoreductase [Ilumatobacteraceae bacterium]
MTRLAGKVALITGVGVGIGRVAALRFAEEGAIVVGCDLNAETSAETVRLFVDAGGAMTAKAPIDLSSYEATEAWVSGAAIAGLTCLQQCLPPGGRSVGRPHRRRLACRYSQRAR